MRASSEAATRKHRILDVAMVQSYMVLDRNGRIPHHTTAHMLRAEIICSFVFLATSEL
jgi:hypothetical protein